MALRAIWHCMDQYNIIWTEARQRSIYYFVCDLPVHKLPFVPKCHEIFSILYSILAKLSDDMRFDIEYLGPKKCAGIKSGRKHYIDRPGQ
jgi:hypothetical protein